MKRGYRNAIYIISVVVRFGMVHFVHYIQHEHTRTCMEPGSANNMLGVNTIDEFQLFGIMKSVGSSRLTHEIA
ncbi:hypothetical protein RSOLAG1IB_00328 [Rhizoctonia solani AG-1 IB]|uniref:Uncharacterized protein n=1 Tax=Thanatephorus cucumeris (strain AG1-IB / isolate 7/3/14) TaxID=1108050 RepID=A0A0B7F6G2_THACB|nr:hypothetical protein RSOLAG1IB_00328 [Rhizoctonia solani AG-1 IB]